MPFVLTGGRRNVGFRRNGSDDRPPASSVPTGTARYWVPSTAYVMGNPWRPFGSRVWNRTSPVLTS